MVTTLFSTLDWLPGFETWGIVGIGALATMLAFWLGRLTAGKPPVQEEIYYEPEMDPFSVGSPAEKRASARRSGNPIEIYLAARERIHPPMHAWVVDRSIGGLRIRVEQQVASGTILRARPRQAPPGAPWVEIEVKSCSRDGTDWQIGCAYLQPPSWSIQLLFG